MQVLPAQSWGCFLRMERKAKGMEGGSACVGAGEQTDTLRVLAEWVSRVKVGKAGRAVAELNWTELD